MMQYSVDANGRSRFNFSGRSKFRRAAASTRLRTSAFAAAADGRLRFDFLESGEGDRGLVLRRYVDE